MSTKAELQDTVEQLEDLLEEALDAELSREEVIGKLKEMKGVIEEPEEEEEGDEDEDDRDCIVGCQAADERRRRPTQPMSQQGLGGP
jgi:hypothetical protein